MKKILMIVTAYIAFSSGVAFADTGLVEVSRRIVNSDASCLDSQSPAQLAAALDLVLKKEVRAIVSVARGYVSVDKVIANLNLVKVASIDMYSAEVLGTQEVLTDLATRRGFVFIKIIE